MQAKRTIGVLVNCLLLLFVCQLEAGDWPQWRGPHRDARVEGFQAPKTWPKELTKKWTVKVGDGVATPALVGDKLYVFTREGDNEITRCLKAATGEEVWQDKYEAPAVRGIASSFPGPRCSPAVGNGKVVTLGVAGTLSCLDAAKGTKLWRKNDFAGALPKFSTSSSPMIVDHLCIAQLGGDGSGAIVAYELADGSQKWKWTEDGTTYSSPVLDGKEVVAETAENIVGLSVAEGKLLWKTPFKMGYNACTPIVDGSTIIFSGTERGRGGRGGGGRTRAVKIEKEGEGLTAKELWTNKETSVQFNSPVLKNGLLFGIASDSKLFCMSARDGKTAWTEQLPAPGRSRGYGSVVDAGPVLLALTPVAELIVFEPTDKQFKEVARYKVSEGGTYAYPVLAGKRIYIKDRDSVILWTID